jgi:hypothetical protein
MLRRQLPMLSAAIGRQHGRERALASKREQEEEQAARRQEEAVIMALSDLLGSRPKAAQFRPRRRVRLSPWAARSEVRGANRAAKVIDPKSVVYSTKAPSCR